VVTPYKKKYKNKNCQYVDLFHTTPTATKKKLISWLPEATLKVEDLAVLNP